MFFLGWFLLVGSSRASSFARSLGLFFSFLLSRYLFSDGIHPHWACIFFLLVFTLVLRVRDGSGHGKNRLGSVCGKRQLLIDTGIACVGNRKSQLYSGLAVFIDGLHNTFLVDTRIN